MATLAEIHALGWTVSDHLLNQLLMNQITRPTQVFDSDRITDVGGTYSSGSTLNYVKLRRTCFVCIRTSSVRETSGQKSVEIQVVPKSNRLHVAYLSVSLY